MKSQFALAAAAGAVALGLASQRALADDGTWSNTASGTWGDPLNWSGGTIADGAGFTADFNTLDLTADVTVTLDTPRTIGNLVFGDADPLTPGGWLIGTGGVATNTLTLDGPAPTITVNPLGTGEVARIDAVIAGTNGLTKSGAGTLHLAAANTYTGGTTITGSTVIVGSGTVATGANFGAAGNTVTLSNATITNGTTGGNGAAGENYNFVVNGNTTVNMGNRMTWGGATRTTTINNGATLTFNLASTVSRDDLSSAFANGTGGTGTVAFIGSGNARLMINGGGFGTGFNNLAVTVDGSAGLSPTTNSGGNPVNVGSLAGSSATAGLNGGSAGAPTWNIGGLNTSTTFAGGIRGNSILNKVGTGTLTLTNPSDLVYTGATNANGGVLKIDGNKSGVGAVIVNNGGTLAGTGTVAGLTTVVSGGHLAPGSTSTVGAINLSNLTLNAGSLLDVEFSGTANDLVNVTTAGGLTINGGSVSLLHEGASTPFATDGVYNLIGYSGAIGGTGAGALAIANPESGKLYNFNSTGSFVTLAISSAGGPVFWNQPTGGTWGDAANWTAGGPPNAQGAFAAFGGGGTAITAPATVTLDGNKTAGTVAFNSANPFTIAQGSGGSLALDNASTAAAITNALGSHTISAPVTVTPVGVEVNVVNAADGVTLSGAVSGAGPITNLGAGTLVLAAANPGYTGTASASAGELVLGDANALAAGTLGGGAGNVGFGSNTTYNVAALGSGAITAVDAATLAVGANDASTTFSGALAGPVALVKNGTGTLVLTGGSSYTGGLAVNGGTVTVRAAQTYGGNTSVASGATLALDTGSSVTGDISLANGATFSMLATGSGTSPSIFPGNSLLLANGATATITSAGLGNGYNGPVVGDAASVLSVTGQTSFGATTASANPKQLQSMAGTLRVETGATLRFSATSLANGGDNTTFDVLGTLTTRNGGPVALGSLTGTGVLRGANNAAGTGTYAIGASNASTTFAGTIEDGGVDRFGAITKVGTGTLTLTGSNTYTGTTQVNDGVLLVAGSAGQALGGTGSVGLNGGSLRLGAANQVNDLAAVTFNGGALDTAGLDEALGVATLMLTGVIDLGLADSVLTFADSSGVTWEGTNLDVWNWTGTPQTGGGLDQLYFGTSEGGLTPDQLGKIRFFSDAGTTMIAPSAEILTTGEVVPVPEPAGLALLGLGAAACLTARRRRRQS